MSIQDISIKFKRILADTDVLLTILIVIVGLSSFFLGRASVGVLENGRNLPQVNANTIEASESREVTESVFPTQKKSVLPAESGAPVEGGYVASKSGTKYHLPWCGSAKQIKEENKIWFATKAEAEAAGYLPAANCKGI